MKYAINTTFVTLALVASVLCFSPLHVNGQENSDSTKNKPLHQTDDEVRALMKGNYSFSIPLLRTTLDREGGWQKKNVFISPWSITTALSMARHGTGGETKNEMTKVLGLENLTENQISSAFQKTRSALTDTGDGVTLNAANSLWIHDKFTFQKAFLKRNRKQFGAAQRRTNFDAPDVEKKVNGWVDRKTNGKIKKIISDLSYSNRGDLAVLLNAIYFNGSWTVKFDQKHTEKRPFTLSDGTRNQVPMMMQTEEPNYRYMHRESFKALRLPYGQKERFGMIVFLPHSNSDLGTFLERLNPERLRGWIGDLNKQRKKDLRKVSLPRFSVEYGKVDVKKTLKRMGMKRVFEKSANLSPMFQENPPAYVSNVFHKAVVEVTEQGTEAAATTAVKVQETSLKPRFQANRPFFYVIRDRHTGTILFMGTMIDPGATKKNGS